MLLLLLLADLAVEPKLEAVAQSDHMGVLILLHLEGVRYHFYVPHVNG